MCPNATSPPRFDVTPERRPGRGIDRCAGRLIDAHVLVSGRRHRRLGVRRRSRPRAIELAKLCDATLHIVTAYKPKPVRTAGVPEEFRERLGPGGARRHRARRPVRPGPASRGRRCRATPSTGDPAEAIVARGRARRRPTSSWSGNKGMAGVRRGPRQRPELRRPQGALRGLHRPDDLMPARPGRRRRERCRSAQSRAGKSAPSRVNGPTTAPSATCAPGPEHGERPDPGVLADLGPQHGALGHLGARPDRAVDDVAVGPDLGPGPQGHSPWMTTPGSRTTSGSRRALASM